MSTKRNVLPVGTTILNGRYEILKVIHTSGMANIYLVTDKNLNKQWALKEIVMSMAKRNVSEYKSLLQEANIMKSLNHSNIPRIVTIDNDGDSLFIVMDYVDGLSVKNMILRKGRIDQKTTVAWMKQVATVLIYLHNRKNPIFYRDMKPENIMVSSDGNIKVLDFGISEIITPDNQYIKEAWGTAGYAAPEQYKKGSKYDLRSDIYAFGRTMYYMLTGLNPVALGKELRPIRQIDSSISVGLEEIITKCIQPNPDDRYQSMEEVLYYLQNYDKLDGAYKKRLWRKVYITFSLYIAGFLLIALSAIPKILDTNQINVDYQNKIELAEKTERSEDYIKGINVKPEILDPYFGLVESFKTDGVFDKDEEKSLLDLLSGNLEYLKDDEKYGEFSYEVGKLYWFYYSGEDGDVVSTTWFKESMDLGYNEEMSTTYYNLGMFKKDIQKAIIESDDSGMYKKYWENLIKAKDTDGGEMIELQLYSAIAEAISNYSYRFNTDGVSEEELRNAIVDIGKYLNSYIPSNDKAKSIYDNIERLYPMLSERVDVAYSGRGER